MNIQSPIASVIIRTKNEERWVAHCLRSVFDQTIDNFEVIIVDNKSTDNTLQLARRFPVKVVEIENYLPGLSLNAGIDVARGEYIVCLSSHCIPKHNNWLANLLTNFDTEPNVAGVYGRQVPVKYSADIDKRDLMITFGLDRRVQIKDTFFHNANSAIRRDILESIPFDSTVSNIEDRAWAKQVISCGYKLVYEPAAEVYHHHGIHHGMSEQRCRSTVRVLEGIHAEELDDIPHSMRPENSNNVAFLPVSGAPKTLGGHDLLERAIKELLDCSHINDVCVLADDETALRTASHCGAIQIERSGELLAPGKSIETSLAYGLSVYEKDHDTVDNVVFMNYLYPFRPKDFFFNLLEECSASGADSALAARPNYGVFWVKADNEYSPVGDDFRPRSEKNPIYRGMWGLGCVSAGNIVRAGSILGEKVNLIELVEDKFAIKVDTPFWESIAIQLLNDPSG